MLPKKITLTIVPFVFVLLIIVLFLLLPYGYKSNPSSSLQGIPTATPILIKKPSQTTVTNTNYTISVPSDWKLVENVNSDDSTKRFTFMSGGKEYSFSVLPRGSSSLQQATVQADAISEEGRLFQGRQFLIRKWYKNGAPFFLLAIPNEANFTMDAFSMDLPPDSQKYEKLFVQVLSTIQFSQKGILLTPAPTLIAPLPYRSLK